MSGAGLISVRLPRSLMGVFREGVSKAGIDIHMGARRLICALKRFTPDELRSLPEPPKELDNPRLSLYVGWQCIDVLAEINRQSQLSTSSVIRRLIYALLVTGSIQFVQNINTKELRLARVQNDAEKVNAKS